MYRTAAVVIASLLVAFGSLSAADFNGVWKGKAEFPGGQVMELTYDLKAAQDKLSGTIESPRGKIDIDNGEIHGDAISFTTKRGDVSVKHSGKLSDGKITITVHTSGGDREYMLKRIAEMSGNWVTSITTANGTAIPLKYDFKVDGEKLSGTVEGPRGKIDLHDGKINGEQISYKVTIGDNDVSYEGKFVDGKIKLQSHSGPLGDREYTLTRPLELAGAWESKFKNTDGTEVPLHFDFKIQDDMLTGTVDGPHGKYPITNGKIAGDIVSFNVDIDGNLVKHKGTIKPGEFKLTVNGFDQEWELTLTRMAAK